jgi:hypothetical protein
MKDKKNEQHDEHLSPELRTEILAEYTCLRSEILKRLEIRNRLMTFSLIVAGTIIAFGSKAEVTVFVLLLYPILAFFLALAWMQTDMQIGAIGSYIREKIEQKLEGLNWETFYKKKRIETKNRTIARPIEISAAGVFFITEILAVLLSFEKLPPPLLKLEYLFLLLDVVAIILTFIIIRQRRIRDSKSSKGDHTMIAEQNLKEICINVGKKLVAMPDEKNGLKNHLKPRSRLIFPQYEFETKEKQPRISEQEARVLFCQEIENHKQKELYYSIETPSDKKYSFGKTLEDIRHDKDGQSALFDMSLFQLDEKKQFTQVVNIEFKAHNAELIHITKDFLKLVYEKPYGLFFHVLKTVDSGTLYRPDDTDKNKGIIRKYIDSISKSREEWNPKGSDKFIMLAICILEKKLLLLKTIKENHLKDIEAHLKIIYQATRTGISVQDANGWEIKKLD